MSTFHYSGRFSPEDCKRLIAYALKQYPAQKAITGGAPVEGLRESDVRWLNTWDDHLYPLIARIQHLYTDAQVNCFGMRDMYGLKELQFTTYQGANAGHYDFHQDNGTGCVGADRRLSMVLLLSDPSEFEGGQFEMKPRLKPDCLAKQGDVLFFRSEIMHRVLPVTAGTRHSLVTWFYGARN